MATNIFPSVNNVGGAGKTATEVILAKWAADMSPVGNFVVSGGVLATSASLTLTIPAITANISGYRVELTTSSTLTVTASKINNIWLKLTKDISQNVIGASFVAQDADPGDAVLVGTATASTTAITGVTSESPTVPFTKPIKSSVTTGTAPMQVASTTKVTNLNSDKLDDMESATASTASTIVARDSSGNLTGKQLKSDVADGTAPLTVVSKTMVTNLNAEYLGGKKIGEILLTASAATPATAGWYRIAISPVNIGANSAYFKVEWNGTGVKGRAVFVASCHDGVAAASAINQIGFTTTNAALGLDKVRLVYHTTPTGNYAYVEVNNKTALGLTITVDLLDSTGWSTVAPSTAGSIPSGYTSEELVFDTGYVSMEDITAGRQLISKVADGTAPLVVTSTTKVANLNAERVDDMHADAANNAYTLMARDANKKTAVQQITLGADPAAAMEAATKQYVDSKSTDIHNVRTDTITTTAGWYRIASSPADEGRCAGRFEIDWTVSGNHGKVVFNAGQMYGAAGSVALNQVAFNPYTANNGITQARVVYHTTYTGNTAYLEVYMTAMTSVVVTTDMVNSIGWSLIAPVAGSIPSGYTSESITFALGFVTSEQVVVGANPTSNLQVATKQYVDAKTWQWDDITDKPAFVNYVEGVAPRSGAISIFPKDLPASAFSGAPAWRRYPDGSLLLASFGGQVGAVTVSFKGTALSMTALIDPTGGRTYSVQVDGGAVQNYTLPTGITSTRTIATLASGLTYGDHTVVITAGSTTTGVVIYEFFAVATTDRTTRIDAGKGFTGGKAYTVAAQTLTHAAPTAGQKGRADLIVMNTDGSISIVQGTDGSNSLAYRVESNLDVGVVSQKYRDRVDVSAESAWFWHSTAWSEDRSSQQYSSSEHAVIATSSTTAKVMFAAYCTGIDLIGQKNVDNGIMTVSIDGGAPVDIDCYATSWQKQVKHVVATDLPLGYHVFEFSTTSRKNAACTASTLWFVIDAFDVYLPAEPTPSAGVTPLASALINPLVGAATLASRPTSAQEAGWLRYEQNDPMVRYMGTGWTFDSPDGSKSFASDSYSKTTNDYVEFAFVGSGFRWVANVNPNQGQAEISIDGVVVTTKSAYGSALKWQTVIYENTGLTFGAHTVKIRVTGVKDASATDYFIPIDAFEVYRPIFLQDVRNLAPLSIPREDSELIHIGDDGKEHNLFDLVVPLECAGESLKCYTTAEQGVPHAVWTPIYMDHIDFNGTVFSIIGSKIAVKKSGRYLIVANVEWNQMNHDAKYITGLRKNGTDWIANNFGYCPTSDYIDCIDAGIVELQPGEYIELLCYQMSGATQSIIGVNSNNRNGNSLTVVRLV